MKGETPSQQQQHHLKERWERLMASITTAKSSSTAAEGELEGEDPRREGGGGGVSSSVSSKWWEEVEREYGSPTRWYHALSHLVQMFNELDTRCRGSNSSSSSVTVKHLDRVELAIFFHDLIYDPRSGTNEEDSAGRFRAFARDVGLGEKEEEAVVRYILATKSHATCDEDDEDEDLKLFLDIDMSILGQDRQAYLCYAHKVRREYLHVPRDTYLSRRAGVLSSFLQHGRIYASALYHEALEARARDNLQAEIAMLRSGVIPLEEEEEEEGRRAGSGEGV